MESHERLDKVLSYCNLSYNAFAKKIGIGRAQQLYDIRDGKIKSISLSLATKINSAFPEINIPWLINEDGEMLTSRPVFEAVPLHLADPQRLEANDSKFYDLPDGTTIMQISVVPETAWGSYHRGFADPEFYDGFETIPVPVKKQHRGAYLAFEIQGRSMVNIENEEMARKTFWPGQKIIGRSLKREQWQYKLHIHSNEAWIIVHKVQGIMVKEIIDHDVDTGLLTLHSWNPDKEKFPDKIIHIDDVVQLFNVVDPFGKLRPY